jgi:hypothetical protein
VQGLAREVLPVDSPPSSVTTRATAPWLRGTFWRDLDEDFVGPDHAQVLAGQLFDHVQALLQVAHFVGQALVALLGFRLTAVQLASSVFMLRDLGHAAAAEPQLGVQHEQQRDQQGGDEAVRHDMQV